MESIHTENNQINKNENLDNKIKNELEIKKKKEKILIKI